MAKLKCVVPGTNHSKDRFRVYDGHAEPTILCGYHEQIRHFAAEKRNLEVGEVIAAALNRSNRLPG